MLGLLLILQNYEKKTKICNLGLYFNNVSDIILYFVYINAHVQNVACCVYILFRHDAL